MLTAMNHFMNSAVKLVYQQNLLLFNHLCFAVLFSCKTK